MPTKWPRRKSKSRLLIPISAPLAFRYGQAALAVALPVGHKPVGVSLAPLAATYTCAHGHSTAAIQSRCARCGILALSNTVARSAARFELVTSLLARGRGTPPLAREYRAASPLRFACPALCS